MIPRYYKQLLINSASVLLNVFINWASNVTLVLLNTYKHHHTKELYIFTIFVSMSGPGLFVPYLGDLSFIFIFIFIMINQVIPWVQNSCSFAYFYNIYYYSWLIKWLKNASNFQIEKFSLGLLLRICLIFFPVSAWHCL